MQAFQTFNSVAIFTFPDEKNSTMLDFSRLLHISFYSFPLENSSSNIPMAQKKSLQTLSLATFLLNNHHKLRPHLAFAF